MSRPDQTVIAARVTFDRRTDMVHVRHTDGHTSTHGRDAEHLARAIAGFRVAERAAARSLLVAESAMNNVAGQHGIRWNVRSITQP